MQLNVFRLITDKSHKSSIHKSLNKNKVSPNELFWLLIMTDEPLTKIRIVLLASAVVFAISAVLCSSYLICQHQIHMTNRYVQTKITGILWMVPIYSVNSILSLIFPSVAVSVFSLENSISKTNNIHMSIALPGYSARLL